MNHIPLISLLASLLLGVLTACSTTSQTPYSDDHPEIAAAIAKARRTLPQFWQAFEKRDCGECQFSLKIRIEGKNRVEHFWVTDFERQNGQLIITIDHAPKIVTNVKLGDRLAILEAEIQDWFYVRDGKMIGNQTIRPGIKRMSPPMAAALTNALEDP